MTSNYSKPLLALAVAIIVLGLISTIFVSISRIRARAKHRRPQDSQSETYAGQLTCDVIEIGQAIGDDFPTGVPFCVSAMEIWFDGHPELARRAVSFLLPDDLEAVYDSSSDPELLSEYVSACNGQLRDQSVANQQTSCFVTLPFFIGQTTDDCPNSPKAYVAIDVIVDSRFKSFLYVVSLSKAANKWQIIDISFVGIGRVYPENPPLGIKSRGAI